MKTTLSGPFRTDPRPKWRRTVYAKSPAGYGVEINAPRSAPSPQQYGRECERKAMKELQRDAYTVTRSHLSRGGADLVGIRDDGAVQVQVKSLYGTYRPSWCNDGVREVLQLPTSARRLVFGYIRGQGHVVTVEVLADGACVVTGREPYRGDVERAVGRMRRKG